MKSFSAHTIKAGRFQLKQRLPKEGTGLREAYDLLMANKGKEVQLKPQQSKKHVYQLLDYYGLDIRTYRIEHNQYRYILVGEWFGRVYVDYLAEQK